MCSEPKMLIIVGVRAGRRHGEVPTAIQLAMPRSLGFILCDNFQSRELNAINDGERARWLQCEE